MKPCPRCKCNDARIGTVYERASSPMYVYCPQCFYDGPESDDMDEACELWDLIPRGEVTQ
jgi:hypothetical protein